MKFGRESRVGSRGQGISGSRPSSPNPRRLLLEAAGEVFADVGFRNATIREICRRAGVNVAAVNYHFGDKEQLYAEVLHYSQQQAFEKYAPLLDVDDDAPAEEKLHAYVRSFLLRIFDKGSTAWFGKMMSREMVEPTAALNALLESRMRPMARLLGGIVAQILHEPVVGSQQSVAKGSARRATNSLVRLCSFSVVSQCVFFHHCRTVINRLFPEQKLDASAVEELAGHITRFSLAAMRRLADSKTPNARRRRR
jgi:TetR/AcrR family transcriptional regulator, regulator of cefoperazone and chloramphenicol sensitivity